MAHNDDPQPKLTTVARLKGVEPCEYNIEEITEFISTVFHTLPDLTTVCAYKTKTNRPGYPLRGQEFMRWAKRAKVGLPCYFGTATMRDDPDTGKLFNRQANMAAMHVVVLDDIGTKVPLDKMPPGLDPTYKIETSPGNFQWGLVLEEPIPDRDVAALLIKLVYASGYTDAGGALCNKIVRLPCGINGKKSEEHPEKEKFQVKLLDMEGPYFTPQDILDDLNTGLHWDSLLKDPELVAKQLRRQVGASQYSDIKMPGTTPEGVSDPLIEWLYARKQVVEDAGEWYTIICPWAHNHTEGGDRTAGYSPLGHGEGPHKRTRGFHCFHEHCATKRGQDLLAWVASVGGPQLAFYEEHYDVVANLIYDVTGDNVYNMKMDNYQEQRTHGFGKASFNCMYPGKVEVAVDAGKVFKHSIFDAWMRHPARVVVQGAVSDPCGPVVIRVDGAIPKINIFSMPEYSRHPADQEVVAPFLEFIEYLIPAAVERKYFLDWLACKAQNLRFRGNAIVMVAHEQEGTGRGTLSKIIARVFGQNNVRNEEFGNLIGAQFNSFMQHLFVTCDETLMARGEKQKEEAYERLKSLIEPSATLITVNEKFEKPLYVFGGPSFLFFSNHADALFLQGHARRFYVITNPKTPTCPDGTPDPTVFNAIYDWMETPNWEEEIHNWLMDREVDEQEMMMHAPETKGKTTMRDESGSNAAKFTRAVVAAWPSDILVPSRIKSMVVELGRRLHADSDYSAGFRINKKVEMVDPRNFKSGPARVQYVTKEYPNESINIKRDAVDKIFHLASRDEAFLEEKLKLTAIYEENLFPEILNKAAISLDID